MTSRLNALWDLEDDFGPACVTDSVSPLAVIFKIGNGLS